MQKKNRIPKVHVKDGRYYYVHKNQWTGLSRVDEGMTELHRRLATRTDELPNVLARIFTAYIDGPLKELAPSTRKTYEYFLSGILMHRFGHLMPHEIDEGTIAQYMFEREESGAAVSGNRERSALSSVYEYAMRRGWARRNPCRGARRNKERASKVLVASQNMSDAIDRAPKHFAPVLQFAYMTGVRQSDIILLPVSAITPEGVVFTESKTGKPRIIEWSPTLRGLVREIYEMRGALIGDKPDHGRFFVNRFGQPLTMWGIISNMRRLGVDWSFRAIRPKAQTDAGARNVLGHSGQMRVRYTRREKLQTVY